MLENNKSVLDNPEIKSESTLGPKKSKAWLFKLILILIVIGVVYYFFRNPEGIQSWINDFFGKLLK